MKLYVKYMVSQRCKMVVKEELEKLGLRHTVVDPGMVETRDDLTPEQREQLKVALLKSGLVECNNVVSGECAKKSCQGSGRACSMQSRASTQEMKPSMSPAKSLYPSPLGSSWATMPWF